MRKSIVFLVFLVCSYALQAQNNTYGIEKGDMLLLGEPSGSKYMGIDFPRKNIIIKRGAIANFNDLIGKKVIVQQIEHTKNGEVIATLQRKDGLNFFRFFPKVESNISKAIESGELEILK